MRSVLRDCVRDEGESDRASLDAADDTASLDAAYRARLDRRRDAVVADPRLPPTVCPSLARPHRDLVRRQLAAGIYRPSLFSAVKRIRSTWGIL